MLSSTTQAQATASRLETPGLFIPAQGRALDTRQSGAMVAGAMRDVQIAGVAGVPATGVSAVALTFTSVSPSADGYVNAAPKGVSLTTSVSYLNYLAGTNESSSGAVALGTSGQISVRAPSATHLLIDIQGYYVSNEAPGGGYVPIQPVRMVDTRNGTGVGAGKLAAGAATTVPAADLLGIPDNTAALAVTFTVTSPTAAGFLRT